MALPKGFQQFLEEEDSAVEQPVQTQITERQTVDIQPQQQAINLQQQVVTEQPQVQQQPSDIPIDIIGGQQFVQGIGQPRGDFDPRSQADLLGLRTLVGMSETPESQLATVQARTGDPQARFTGQFPKASAEDISFVDPATGQEIGLRQETGTLGDIAEGVGASGRPVAKTVAGAALGGLGLTADVATGSEGLIGAAGLAAGEELGGQVFDLFARSAGVVDPRGTLAQIGRAGEEVALDVLLPAVLEPLAKAPNRIRKNFVEAIDRRARKQAQEKFSPNEELYDALIESGLEDPTGAWGLITGNPNIKRDLQALQTTPNGRKFRDKVEGFVKFAENKADDLTELSDSKVIDKTVAGSKIKDFATNYDRASADAIRSARSYIKSTSQGNVPINNTLPFIIGRYQEWSELPASRKLIDDNDVMNAIMKDISMKIKTQKGRKLQGPLQALDDIIESGSESIDPVFSDLIGNGFDLDKLLKLRTAALTRERKILDPSDPKKISYSSLANAINRDIESALSNNPKAREKFRRSNKQYALRKKLFNEQLSKFVRGPKGFEVSDDQAFREFITKAKKGPSEIEKVYKKMPVGVKDDVANTLVESMVRDPRQSPALENNFNPTHFLREYRSIPEASKEVIFKHNKGLKEEMDRFASVMEAFQANQRFRNLSGTALFNVRLQDLRNPSEAIFNYLLTVPGVNRISPAYWNSQLMTNKDFLKWVTKGGERPRKGLSSIDAVFKGLPEVIKRNPDIRSDVLQFMRGMASFYDEQAGRENIRQSQPQTPAAGDRRIGIQQAPLVVPNQGNNQRRRQFRPQQAAEMMGVKG